MDRTLNGLIKRAFPAEYRKGVPKPVLDDIDALNETGIKYKAKQDLFAKPAELSTNPGQSSDVHDDADNCNPPRKRRRSNSNAEGRTRRTTTSKAKKNKGQKKGAQKKRNGFSYSAMERLCTVCAIINSLNALTRGNIVSAWKASGLHPFNGKPPVTKEYCDSMRKEMFMCENLGVTPRPRTSDSIVIVGLVNNKEGIERFKKLLQEKELKPRRYRGSFKQGNLSSKIEIVTENEDVGDYIDLEADGDTESASLYGNSDANCYVSKKKHMRVLFRRSLSKQFLSLQSFGKKKHFHVRRCHKRIMV